MLKSKKMLAVFMVMLLALLLAAGCGGTPKNETATSGAEKSSSSEKLKVFKPDELLSEAEAAELTGHPVTLETNTLTVDPEMGTSMTYYKYDLPGGTTLHAGLFLWQNSAAKNGENMAQNQYDSDLNFVKTDSKPTAGLGEKAFYQPSNSSMHVLYSGIYFTVAFDDADDTKNEALNLKIAQKVIDNINKKK